MFISHSFIHPFISSSFSIELKTSNTSCVMKKIRIPRQEFHFQITKTILTHEKYSMTMSTDDNCRSLKSRSPKLSTPQYLEIPEKHRQRKTRISHRLGELRLHYLRIKVYCHSAPPVFFGFACSLFTHSFSCLTGESFSPFLIVYTTLGLFTIANSGPVYMELGDPRQVR